MRQAALLVTLPLCASLFACEQKPEAPAPPPIARVALPAREVFVAMERDFQDFRRWGSEVLSAQEPQGITHPQGERRVYVNALPPNPSTHFPTGTIIVKAAAPDAEGRVRLFGMVKRGAKFNQSGAVGWEWFELKERSDKSVGIAWRGLGAPDGESYGGDPMGTCNTCHQRSAKSDFVMTPKLRLLPDKS